MYASWEDLQAPSSGWPTVRADELFRIGLAPSPKAEPTRWLGQEAFGDVAQHRASGRTVIVFSNPKDGTCGELRVEIGMEARPPETLLTLTLSGAGARYVAAVEFPRLRFGQMTPRDHLLMPTAWGDNIPRPAKTIREIKQGRLSYLYPAELAMQYAVLYNAARSIYCSAYSLSDDTFAITATAENMAELTLCLVHHPSGNGSWTSPPCGIAALPGGWHAAADLYRQRMAWRFRAPDTPPWVRESFHGWAQVCLKREHQPPAYRYRDLPALYQRVRDAGLNAMHVYGWSGEGHDTLYPDFCHNEQLGSAEELASAMDTIRALGGHATLYTNGRLVDPASQFCRACGGQETLSLGPDGTPYYENYGTDATFGIACLASERYRAYFRQQIERIVSSYHAHGIQIDQISCNPGNACYVEGHGHDTPWNNALQPMCELLANLREAYRRADPDFYTWAEGCHERYGQLYDVNQGHGEHYTWQIGESLAEQFRYTYPAYVVTGLSEDMQQLAHTFAQGKPFDLHMAQLESADYMRLLRDLLTVRKEQPAYYLHGTFLGSAGLHPTHGALAYAMGGRDGRLYSLWSPGASLGQEVTAHLWGAERGAIRPVYPGDLRVEQETDGYNARWSGPVAAFCVA